MKSISYVNSPMYVLAVEAIQQGRTYIVAVIMLRLRCSTNI